MKISLLLLLLALSGPCADVTVTVRSSPTEAAAPPPEVTGGSGTVEGVGFHPPSHALPVVAGGRLWFPAGVGKGSADLLHRRPGLGGEEPPGSGVPGSGGVFPPGAARRVPEPVSEQRGRRVHGQAG